MTDPAIQEIKPVIDRTPCGVRFISRLPCGAPADHPIHNGRWKGREPNHDYQRNDRRRGIERRRRPAVTAQRSASLVRQLYRGLQERPQPEDVAPIVADLLGLTPAERAKFPTRRWSSSMSAEWAGAVPVERPLASLAAILGRVPPSGRDPEGVAELLREAREYARIEGGASFRNDRLNRAKRRVAGIGDLSRRRYDKVFRLVGRIEARVKVYETNRELADLAHFAKVGFASEVPWSLFRRSPSSAAFVAYHAANAGRRSLFTIAPQKRAMDVALKTILTRCEADEAASWLAIAYAFPREDVLARCSVEDRAELLALALRRMGRLAELLEACVTPTMDLKQMIVRRGDDSSTWNALAGAWNRARELWLATAWSLDPSIADAFLPGKVLRLMAADVAAWHRSAKGGLDPDTRVWADLPRPWQVLSGERSCSRELVVSTCVLNGVDPESSGWAKPRPRVAVDSVAPTPELVHGVVVSHPQLAALLRKAGWFSGYEARVREVAPVIAAAGVEERETHTAAQDPRPATSW